MELFKLTTLYRTELVCNSSYEEDRIKEVEEITEWTLRKIEESEFQSGDAKIELIVGTPERDYTIMLYRDNQYLSVWLDGNFAYEIPLSADLRSRISELFYGWRRVPGVKMIYRGDWNDPQLKFNGKLANYWQIEDTLYTEFIYGLKDSKKYDNYIKQSRQEQERRFNNWLFDNYYKIVDAFNNVS